MMVPVPWLQQQAMSPSPVRGGDHRDVPSCAAIPADDKNRKPKKSVQFEESCQVVHVPTRKEYVSLDLWWTMADYHGFRRTKWQERCSPKYQDITSSSRLPAFDIKILIIWKGKKINSPLTQHLSAAISHFEKERLGSLVAQVRNGGIESCIADRQIRSSVTEVELYSKGYIQAMQGSQIHYNVIVYCENDDARDLRGSHINNRNGDMECLWEPKLSASYMHATRNSYLQTASTDIDSMLLGKDDVPMDEKSLLRQIIKSGVALAFVSQRQCVSSLCHSQKNDFKLIESIHRKENRELQSSVNCAKVVTPSVETKRSFELFSTVNDLVRPSPNHLSLVDDSKRIAADVSCYSLLRDHADIVLNPRQQHSDDGCSCPTTPTSEVPPPPPTPPLRSPANYIEQCVLTVEDWLRLFRLVKQRIFHPSDDDFPKHSMQQNTNKSVSSVSSQCVSLLSLQLESQAKVKV